MREFGLDIAGGVFQFVDGVEAHAPTCSAGPDEVAGRGGGPGRALGPNLDIGEGRQTKTSAKFEHDQIAHVNAALDAPTTQIQDLLEILKVVVVALRISVAHHFN